MNDWIVPLFWGVAGAVLAGIVIRVQLKNRASRRRDRELQVESARLGLSYQADGLAVVDTFIPFVLLDRRPETRTRTARNLMRGEKRGIGVVVFDFDHHKAGRRIPGAVSTRMQWSDVNTAVVLGDAARPWPTSSLKSIWAGPQTAWTAKALAFTKALAADGAGLAEFDSHPLCSWTRRSTSGPPYGMSDLAAARGTAAAGHKTSLVFRVANRPGALFECRGHLPAAASIWPRSRAVRCEAGRSSTCSTRTCSETRRSLGWRRRLPACCGPTSMLRILSSFPRDLAKRP